jgi:hypothetical protein
MMDANISGPVATLAAGLPGSREVFRMAREHALRWPGQAGMASFAAGGLNWTVEIRVCPPDRSSPPDLAAGLEGPDVWTVRASACVGSKATLIRDWNAATMALGWTIARIALEGAGVACVDVCLAALTGVLAARNCTPAESARIAGRLAETLDVGQGAAR